MGKKMTEIPEPIQEFIKKQKVFFVGTAAPTGRVNVSPKGMDSFKVINANKVVWLNLTGSGNETAAHLLQNNRMTIMWCAFEGAPMILRLYGSAKIYHLGEPEFDQYVPQFEDQHGARQVVVMNVDMVMTSCGFGVPLMDFTEKRTTLTEWSERKGDEGLKKYWEEKNVVSIDGFDTGMKDHLN